jgi:hypothetical protein
MKNIIKTLAIIALAVITISCNTDDGTSTTGNTQEYFKYKIDDGPVRTFDYQAEGHLETDTSSIIDRYEINAIGISADTGEVRRIGGSFTFDSSGPFMPNTVYNWGWATDNDPTAKFFFIERTPSNLFALSLDFTMSAIITEVTSPNPTNIGDYLEFVFAGTYQDANNVTHSIEGQCRVLRDMDQNNP